MRTISQRTKKIREKWLALAAILAATMITATPLSAEGWLSSQITTLHSLTVAESSDDETDGANKERLRELFEGATPENLSELRMMEEHFAELAQQVIPAVVGVRVGQSQGSGVIISKDGYVLTAGHVVGSADQEVTFIMPDGRELTGTTLGANFGIDSGLMRIETEGDFPYVDMGSSSQLGSGQWVMAIGHPGGYEAGRTPVVRVGRVLSNDNTQIRTDCALVGGDSGGPLFDMQGTVIGINSRIGSQLSSNIHVPVNTYAETWDRLAASEEWGPVRSNQVNPANAPYIGVTRLAESEDATISEVDPDGPASEAGIEAGDTITKFDGRVITSFESLVVAVLSKQPGDEVELEVVRGDELLKFQLTIGSRSE